MQCRCGNELVAGAKFCAACGAPAPGVAMSAGIDDGVDAEDAGFWRRLVAYLLDRLILVIPLAVLQAVVLAVNVGEGGAFLLTVLVAWLYFALQECSEHQATLGKRALGLRVIGLNGERLDFGQASARYFAAALNYITLYIGYAMVGLTERKQGLHDMVASTRVVNRQAGARLPGWAIAILVVVVLAVPMMGVLAAIAIPAYSDYTVKAKVGKAIADLAPVRLAYAEYLEGGRGVPTSISDLGVAAPNDAISRVEIEDGLIVIRFNADAGAGLAGRQVALQPLHDASQGSVSWLCGNSTEASAMVERGSGEIRAAAATTLDARYLPASCR